MTRETEHEVDSSPLDPPYPPKSPRFTRIHPHPTAYRNPLLTGDSRFRLVGLAGFEPTTS